MHANQLLIKWTLDPFASKKVLIFQPLNFPRKEITSIKLLLSKFSGIELAYYSKISIHGADKIEHDLVGLKIKDKSESTFIKLLKAVEAKTDIFNNFVFTQLVPDDPFSDSLLRTSLCIYKR
jgi:hypothetical protein